MTKASRLIQEQNRLLRGPSGFDYQVSTSVIHDRIHQGAVFETALLNQTLADDGTIGLLIRPDPSISMHARFTVAVGGDMIGRLYKGATFSAAGGALVAENRNQLSANTALGIVTSDPTITAPGTEMIPGGLFFPGGTGFLSGGSSDDLFNEWILAPGVVYYAQITNISGGVNPAQVQLDFYEPIELLG